MGQNDTEKTYYRQLTFPELKESGVLSLEDGNLLIVLNQLKASLIQAFHFKCFADWQLHPRTLNNPYITLLLSGSGQVTMGGIAREVKAGDLIIFASSQPHSMRPAEGVEMEMVNVHFHAQIGNGAELISLLNLSGVHHHCDLLAAELIKQLAILYAEPTSKNRKLLDTDLHTLLLNLGRRYGSMPFDIQDSALLKISGVLDFIEKELGNPGLNLASLKGKTPFSEVYLRRLFKQALGQTPIEFIHRRRIVRAEKMLRESDDSIKNIAEECGFSDLRFFYRVFKKFSATTPHQFRHRTIV